MAKEGKGQNPNHPNELEQLRAKADELQKLVAEKEEELAARERKISQLEQAIADRDSQIAGIKQQPPDTRGVDCRRHHSRYQQLPFPG